MTTTKMLLITITNSMRVTCQVQLRMLYVQFIT